METIGVVFVVVIMVIALMIFIAFSGNSTSSNDIKEADLYGKALETAMLETTIPECQYDLATALDRCVTQPYLRCGIYPVCDVAEDAWLAMLSFSISQPYKASVQHNDDLLFLDDPNFCEGPNRLAAPSQVLHTNAGELRFIIEFC